MKYETLTLTQQYKKLIDIINMAEQSGDIKLSHIIIELLFVETYKTMKGLETLVTEGKNYLSKQRIS